MAERVGFEFTRKRSFNNIERTAGTVKQWKAVASSANGSQTDHGSASPETRQRRLDGTLTLYCVITQSRQVLETTVVAKSLRGEETLVIPSSRAIRNSL